MSIPVALVDAPAPIRAALFDTLTREHPDAAALFPQGAREVPQQLLDAAVWTLTHSPSPEIPEGVAARLEAWALDLRRLGIPPAQFVEVAGMLADVASLDDAPRATLLAAAERMRAAAEAADLAGVPPAHAALITEVVPATADGRVRIARLEAGSAVTYAPGQALPVMLPGEQGVWRGLAPATPANDFGQLEFHVDRGAVVPGSYVTLGAPRGASPALDVDATIVAVGTGLAAAKALVFDVLSREPAARQCVQLFIAPGASSFYDLPTFAALAASQPWLEVHCVVEGDVPAGTCGLPVVQGPVTPEHVAGRAVVVCGGAGDVDKLARALPGATVLAHDAGWDWSSPPA